MQHRIRGLTGLEKVLRLTADERKAVQALEGRLPLSITPYYAGLLSRTDPRHALRRAMIPVPAEFRTCAGEFADPLGEDRHSPVPGLVHTYPDKVLFLVTDRCPVYCRYCTRARLVGSGAPLSGRKRWEKAIRHIARTKAIRDVLISGGEPLLLPDAQLDWLLAKLRAIRHVEIIRISTKAPAALPQRITPALVRILKRHHPLWMSVHFTHPDELTPEARAACNRIADAGIPMCSQTVLLKGVNDSPAVMKKLMLGLLRMRVKPYYLHQCDAIAGSAHFRTPVRKGLEIIRRLHGFTTGYAVPMYMIDAPGGGGKVPVAPDYVVRRRGPDIRLRNYKGRVYSYREG